MKNVTVKGKQVKRITLNGGIFFEKSDLPHVYLPHVRGLKANFDSGTKNLRYVFDLSTSYTESGIKIAHGSGSSGGHYLGVQSGKYSLGGGKISPTLAITRKTVIHDNSGSLLDPREACLLIADGITTERTGVYPQTSNFRFWASATAGSFYDVVSDLYENGIQAYSRDGVLLHDWKAVQIKATGEITLYDEVTKTYLINIGEPLYVPTEQSAQLLSMGISPQGTLENQIQQLNEMGVE